MTDPSSLPATHLTSPRPPHPPVIIFVENYPAFHGIIGTWVEQLSPHTHLLFAQGPVDFADLLKMHGSAVVGILTDGHLSGGTAHDIVRTSDATLGRKVPFLVVSANPTSFPPSAFSRAPVAVRSKGDNLGRAVFDLLKAIAAPSS